MDTRIKFDVFISYRRDGGEVLGRLLFELLKNEYNVFFDHETLSSGRFDKKLLNIIEECNDFIVILSKNCLARCSNEGDWFMQEIRCALQNNKNIILLMDESFIMPTGAELLSYSSEIQDLLRYNGYQLSVAYIDSIVAKLRHDMKTPRREVASPFDSISEWNVFNKCLEDKKFADFLPDSLKMSIINNAVSSFLDEYSAKILTNMLTKLSDKVYNVRTKFRYEVDIKESFDFKILDIDPDKYYEISESLSYTKIFRSEKPDEHFWISFATKLTNLDSELHSENFFFSENLTISAEDMKLLSELSDDDKEEFYTSAMRVKLNINGEILSPEEIIVDDGGIFARYSLPQSIDTDVLNVKLRFKVPQGYTNSFFFACISEPTYSPFVRISYDEDAFDVEMVPFLTRSITAKDTKIFEGVRELSVENEWIMPISGAIFLINKMN